MYASWLYHKQSKFLQTRAHKSKSNVEELKECMRKIKTNKVENNFKSSSCYVAKLKYENHLIQI